MQIRGSSSRRSLVSLCGVLCVGLVLALPVAGAVGGSRLPAGARFHKSLGEGRSLTVQVKGKGVSVTLSGVPIRCAKPTAAQGGEAHVGLGLAGSEPLEVGKAYKLTKTKTRSEGGSTSSSTTEVTLDFKSAQQVRVTIHQVAATNGKTDCDGSGSYTVKRQG